MDDEERRQARVNAEKERLQRESLLHLTRHGFPWTPEEDEVIREEGWTNPERAEILGRTYHTVVMRRAIVRAADEAGEEIHYSPDFTPHDTPHHERSPRRQRPPCNCATLDPDLHEDWCSSYSTEEEV